MSEHTPTFATEPWRTTVTCSCGWEFSIRVPPDRRLEGEDEDIASGRHAQHVGIEAARKALRKETAE